MKRKATQKASKGPKRAAKKAAAKTSKTLKNETNTKNMKAWITYYAMVTNEAMDEALKKFLPGVKRKNAQWISSIDDGAEGLASVCWPNRDNPLTREQFFPLIFYALTQSKSPETMLQTEASVEYNGTYALSMYDAWYREGQYKKSLEHSWINPRAFSEKLAERLEKISELANVVDICRDGTQEAR